MFRITFLLGLLLFLCDPALVSANSSRELFVLSLPIATVHLAEEEVESVDSENADDTKSDDGSSGKARPIGKHLPLNDLDSLTFDARGRLLTTDGMGLDDKIYQLDRQGVTAPTPLAPTPPIIESSRDIEGLTFAADGKLYGVTHPNPEKRGPRKSYLVRIDPKTFEYQNLGVLNFGTFCIAADLRKGDVVPVQD